MVLLISPDNYMVRFFLVSNAWGYCLLSIVGLDISISLCSH